MYRQFLDFIFDELLSCAVVVDKEQILAKKKKILLIKSVNDGTFLPVIKDILACNSALQVVVIGDVADEELFSMFGTNITRVISHKGRFSVESAQNVLREVGNEGFDGVVMVNYSAHKENYLNVEEFTEVLNCGIGANRAYTYVAFGEELVEYTDLKKHVMLMGIYTKYLDFMEYTTRKRMEVKRTK